MTKNSNFCPFFSFDNSKRHFFRIFKANYLTVPIGRLVLVKLMVAFLSIQSLIILVFRVLHNRIEYSSWYEMRTCRSVYGEQNWTIYHSIPHCPSGKRICKTTIPRNLATLLNRAKLEYLSLIEFHTAIVARECVKRSKTKKCGYIA